MRSSRPGSSRKLVSRRAGGLSRDEINRRALEFGATGKSLGWLAAKGGIVSGGSQFVKMGSQLLITAILARLLSPADFGLVAMAVTVTGFASMFTDLGLSTATVQQEKIDHETVNALFYSGLLVSLAVLLAIIAVAPLAAWFFGDERIFALVAAMGITIPLIAAGSQHAAILRRGMRWAALEGSIVFSQLSAGMLAIALAAIYDIGYWALVVQAWTAAAINLVLFWLACPWRPGRAGQWHKSRGALHFGLHLTGFNFFNYFNRKLDDVLLGWRWGAVELGYYSRAYSLLLLPLQAVNAPLGAVFIPALSRLQSEPVRWRAAFIEVLSIVALLSSAVTAVLVACAEPVVGILYGAQWTQSGPIFVFLATSIFAANVMNALGWIYVSLGQTKRMMYWGFLAAPVLIGAFVVGLPGGALGIAKAYSAAVAVLFLPAAWYATAKAPIEMTAVLKAALAPFVAGLACALLGRSIAPVIEQSALVVAVVIGSIVMAVYLVLAVAILLLDPAHVILKRRILAAIDDFRLGRA